jgi:hypothetical protein
MTQFILVSIIGLVGVGCGWFLHWRFGSTVATAIQTLETDVKSFGKPK